MGFVGTARGMGLALAAAPSLGSNEALQQFVLIQTTRNLGFTFDCTLVALSLSVVLMFFIHLQQRSEEHLVLDAQQFCLERLLTKLVNLDQMVMVGSMDRCLWLHHFLRCNYPHQRRRYPGIPAWVTSNG